MTATPSAHTPVPAAAPLADDSQVEAFVRRHQRGVWRFLRALGCAAATADEIAQDALLLALDRAVTEDAAPGFLRQTAKFLWLRRQRDEARANTRLLAAAERLWQRDCAHDDGEGVLASLRTCLATLPPRSRLVIERTYRDEVGRRELAAELALSEHGVRSLLQRLRATLRQCIERRLTR